MRPGSLKWFLPVITLVFGVAAAGSRVPAYAKRPTEWQIFGAGVYAELAKAPEKARIRPNPLESDPQAVAAGKLLFADHCAECHGDDGKGARKGPSLRAPEVQSATPGTLFWILTNGVVRKKMPSWSKLPEPQRWQLVRYLKTLQTE
jgi:mono/diheme cytochrome c family protein